MYFCDGKAEWHFFQKSFLNRIVHKDYSIFKMESFVAIFFNLT